MTGSWKTFAKRALAYGRSLGVAPVAAILLAGLVACDSAPSPTDGFSRPPLVSDLVFSPGVIEVDELPQGSLVGESVRVSVSISAAASDPDGDLQTVAFVLQAPLASNEPVASGVLSAAGGGRYAIQTDILFPVALTGSYVLIVYASDEAGMLGNEVRGVIELAALGGPPVIESVDFPATVQRPADGEAAVPIMIVAQVSDPDGLANVARVEVRFNGGSPLLLCDDGGQDACNPGFASGDETAGDGLFTLTIQVESTNALGDISLEFVATDRSGLASDPVTRVLTIE